MSYIRSGNFQQALFLNRVNRFVVTIQNQDKILRCHLPNPGRMVNLLIEQKTKLLYIPVDPNSKRKTDGTVIGVLSDDEVINLDTMMFNPLLTYTIENNNLELFSNWKIIRGEYSMGNHRFDFLLDINDIQVITEVKSTTRVVDGIACFPDAVSDRAQKHVLKLKELTDQGLATMILFVVYQKAKKFKPCRSIDPDFADIFDNVMDKLTIHVLQVRGKLIDEDKIKYTITRQIPILRK